MVASLCQSTILRATTLLSGITAVTEGHSSIVDTILGIFDRDVVFSDFFPLITHDSVIGIICSTPNEKTRTFSLVQN
jgi:hypothetical protein